MKHKSYDHNTYFPGVCHEYVTQRQLYRRDETIVDGTNSICCTGKYRFVIVKNRVYVTQLHV